MLKPSNNEINVQLNFKNEPNSLKHKVGPSLNAPCKDCSLNLVQLDTVIMEVSALNLKIHL